MQVAIKPFTVVPYGCSILYTVKGDIGGILTYSDGFMYVQSDNL